VTARRRDRRRDYRIRCDREEGPIGPDECTCSIGLSCACNDCLSCELRVMRIRTSERRIAIRREAKRLGLTEARHD
jgi:hypothetical protein